MGWLGGGTYGSFAGLEDLVEVCEGAEDDELCDGRGGCEHGEEGGSHALDDCAGRRHDELEEEFEFLTDGECHCDVCVERGVITLRPSGTRDVDVPRWMWRWMWMCI